jgi:hypothetical protein
VQERAAPRTDVNILDCLYRTFRKSQRGLGQQTYLQSSLSLQFPMIQMATYIPSHHNT